LTHIVKPINDYFTAGRGRKADDPLQTEIEITLAHVIVHCACVRPVNAPLHYSREYQQPARRIPWLVLMTDGDTAAAAETVVAAAGVRVLWLFVSRYVCLLHDDM
jgi:hypothetical protein